MQGFKWPYVAFFFFFTKVQISGERNCTFKSIFSSRGYCGFCSFVSNVVKSSFGMLNCFFFNCSRVFPGGRERGEYSAGMGKLSFKKSLNRYKKDNCRQWKIFCYGFLPFKVSQTLQDDPSKTRPLLGYQGRGKKIEKGHFHLNVNRMAETIQTKGEDAFCVYNDI